MNVPDLTMYDAQFALTTLDGEKRAMVRPQSVSAYEALQSVLGKPDSGFAWQDDYAGFVATRPMRLSELKALLPDVGEAPGPVRYVEPPPGPVKCEVAGFQISAATVKSREDPDKRIRVWMVECAENQQRRARGERAIGGDMLIKSWPAAAAEAEFQVKQEAERVAREARLDAEEKARADAQMAARADTVNGFTEDHSPMAAGRIKRDLAKQYRFNGVVMSVRERVESLHAAGTLETSTEEERRIQPMSSRASFRASNEEHRAHERRMKEAGMKTTYLVNDSALGKIAYDYAQFLLEERPVASRDDTQADESMPAM